jgi:hypothetical protein
MPRKNRGIEANQVKAVKQQYIQEAENIVDTAYRECRILLQLNHLMLELKCPNFVFLEDWFKVSYVRFSLPLSDYSSLFLFFLAEHSAPVVWRISLWGRNVQVHVFYLGLC